MEPVKPPMTGARADFVLVTALPEELAAVLGKLSNYQQLPPSAEDIRTYYQADLPVTFADHSTASYRLVVMGLVGMGRIQATTAAADVIRRWHPRYIGLVGIAGGLAARQVQLGDVLIADKIVDYELQKLTPQGPEIRWEVQPADARMLNACHNFREEGWKKLIDSQRPVEGAPARHTGPIASGDKVIAVGEVLAKYQSVWPKLVGVEMEAAGVALAAFQAPEKPGFFMVRGVSDLADADKDSGAVKKWRPYACEAAAAFVIALLKSGPVPVLAEASPAALPDPLVRQRLADLQDHLAQELALIKAFEDGLLYEDDPRRMLRYQRELAKLRDSAGRYQAEYQHLSQAAGGASTQLSTVAEQLAEINARLAQVQANRKE